MGLFRANETNYRNKLRRSSLLTTQPRCLLASVLHSDGKNGLQSGLLMPFSLVETVRDFPYLLEDFVLIFKQERHQRASKVMEHARLD